MSQGLLHEHDSDFTLNASWVASLQSQWGFCQFTRVQCELGPMMTLLVVWKICPYLEAD